MKAVGFQFFPPAKRLTKAPMLGFTPIAKQKKHTQSTVAVPTSLGMNKQVLIPEHILSVCSMETATLPL